MCHEYGPDAIDGLDVHGAGGDVLPLMGSVKLASCTREPRRSTVAAATAETRSGSISDRRPPHSRLMLPLRCLF